MIRKRIRLEMVSILSIYIFMALCMCMSEYVREGEMDDGGMHVV